MWQTRDGPRLEWLAAAAIEAGRSAAWLECKERSKRVTHRPASISRVYEKESLSLPRASLGSLASRKVQRR